MKKIKIFAPCDGTVNKIENLNDGVFSEKMLGDGFYIEPESNIFFSPFENATVKVVFDTKHAVFFEANDGPNLLMHIGLDTVNLKGKPFKYFVGVNQNVTTKDKIVEVDINQIKEAGLSLSTPLVVESNEDGQWKFTLKKDVKKVKAGDELGYFSLEQEESISKNIENLISVNKYDEVANQLYKLVGTQSNFSKYYNCMTRFRVIVKDKELVEIDKITKLSIVKGIHWNGEELQIIIGGEVQKVFAAFQSMMLKLNEKETKIKVKGNVKEKIMASLAGIMVPNLPVFISVGMLMAFQSILIQAGVLVKPGAAGSLDEIDHFSQYFFIITDVAFKFLGLFVGYNTIRYLNGNSQMGILICLIIANPYLFQSFLPIWTWFKIGNVSIGLKAYANTILPCIAAMVMYYHLDRWIKRWMPATVDIIFRHAIALIVIVTLTFFFVGPVLGLIESGIGYAVNQIGLIPFGIGVAIFAFVWQPAVVLGIHIAIAMPISIQVQQQIPQLLSPGLMYGAYGQVGALLGIIIRTKDEKLRVASLAALPAGMIGVTEPILYGINLPKEKPFLAGNIGAAIGGVLSGILGVKMFVPGGFGIFSITGYIPGGTTNIVFFVLCLGATLLASALFSLLMYQERPNELKEIRKANNLLIKVFVKRNQITRKQALEIVDNFTKLSVGYFNETEIKAIKELEKEFILLNKLEAKLEVHNSRFNSKKEKYISKLKKLHKANNIKKLETIYKKYEIFANNIVEKEIREKLNAQNEIVKTKSKRFVELQENFMKIVEKQISSFAKQLDFANLNKICSKYYNASHSLDINYGLTQKQEVLFNKKEIYVKGVK